MKTHRLARVAEVVREVASETILFELQDPRIKGVTVTRAEVSADLQHAKVYVSLMGSPQEQKLCMHGLKSAAGFIQSKLGSRLKTRFTPMIGFILDEGVKKSIEVSRLINEALAQSRPKDASGKDASGAEQSGPDASGASDVGHSAEGTAEEHEAHGASKESE
jgi:ribosome-binding factor A